MNEEKIILGICPHCKKEITMSDIQSDEGLSKLKSFFEIHKSQYISDLKKELEKETNLIMQNKIAEKEKDFSKEKSKLETEKNEIIFELKSKINMFNELQEKNKILNEKNIQTEKQKVIDEYKNIINDLQNKIDQFNLVKEKELLEVKNNLEKEKEVVVQKLNDIIAEKEKEVEVTKLNLFQQHQEEIKILQTKIQELEIANAEKRVLQNKFKGETFEQDVHGELEKKFAPEDKIEKITAQDKKADFLQIVRINGEAVGKIVYEVKNAEWSNAWENKLIQDTAKQGAKYGLLVATSFNSKYPNVPFKRSDDNPNIYLSNPDSFIFVGQMIRSLVIVENKFLNSKDDTAISEKAKVFNNWKDIQLPKYNKIFEDECKRIRESEASITKKVDEIRIAREKIYNNWIKGIRLFIESFEI